MPTEVLRTLRGVMGTPEFDYFVNSTPTGALRILVYVEDLTVLGMKQLNLRLTYGEEKFVHRDCRAWRLPCCKEALVADWNYWRSCLEESSGPSNFSKFRVGGTLLDDLTDQVNKRIRMLES